MRKPQAGESSGENTSTQETAEEESMTEEPAERETSTEETKLDRDDRDGDGGC